MCGCGARSPNGFLCYATSRLLSLLILGPEPLRCYYYAVIATAVRWQQVPDVGDLICHCFTGLEPIDAGPAAGTV